MHFFVDQEIAYRLETSSAWRACQGALARSRLQPETQCAIAPIAGGHAIYAGPAAPINRAIGLGFQSSVSVKDFEFMEAFYGARQLPAGVHLCPLAHASFVELLRQRNYQIEKFFNVLARPLSELLTLPQVAQVRVRLVHPNQEALWSTTVAQGFSEKDEAAPELLPMMAATFHSESAKCFLAWVGDEPAGGGAMLMHRGVAKLCSASTRIKFRKIGVQTALLHTRLVEAQTAGCDLAHVLVSPNNLSSQRNIERAGFKLAYTKAVLVQSLATSSKNS